MIGPQTAKRRRSVTAGARWFFLIFFLAVLCDRYLDLPRYVHFHNIIAAQHKLAVFHRCGYVALFHSVLIPRLALQRLKLALCEAQSRLLPELFLL